MPFNPQTYFSHTIDTAQQIESFNAERRISVAFRPVSGLTPSLTFEGGQSSSLSLWQTTSRSGFLTVPNDDLEVFTVRFVTDGSMVRRDHREQHIGRPGHAMMVSFDAMRSEEASADFAAVSGTVTRTALAAAHTFLEKPKRQGHLPRFEPVVDATGLPLQNLMRTMKRVVGQLREGVQTSDLVFPLLEEIMVYRLLTAWPREDLDRVPSGPVGPQPIKRAKAYIDGHLAEKILLSDVASAAGVGVRRLQLVFKGELGKTPVQFILERRLDRVRADLKHANDDGASIGTIATRWGFTHMGDFGRRYRKRFGEVPSVTRRG